MGREQVFISYRRDDSAGYARALHDALARRFGAERVFIDVDDIGAGQAFAAVIAGAVGRSELLLVLIGRRWLGERDGAPPRLHEPGDFVRREVEAALARGLHVIPVLLDGAAMPAAAQLPASLQPLAGRHAVELRGEPLGGRPERLLDAVAAIVEAGAPGPAASPAAGPAPEPAAAALRAGAGLVLLGAAAALVWWARRRGDGAVPARAAVDGLWLAEVVYPWPNARYDERLELVGQGSELRGSASFLTLPRGLVAGRIDGERVQFETRVVEIDGNVERTLVHRYEGRVDGDRLHLTMHTVREGVAGEAVSFVARRQAPPPAVR
ncbi:MAG: toll/interleukin-1 receptor domain-containing protein [Rubrivivax sp.]|nr:toll/interleukin-1 receptor domain-containing protein [Rubrivivax sp.]